jgi:hypothetical protein
MKIELQQLNDKQALLKEKRRIEAMLDAMAIAANGNSKRHTSENIAYALYFIYVIKKLGHIDPKLTDSKLYSVALKIVNDRNDLFYQAIDQLNQNLTPIDNTCLAFLSKALPKYADYIAQYKKQLDVNAKVKELYNKNNEIIASLPPCNEKNIFKRRNNTYNIATEEYAAFKKIYSGFDINNICIGLTILNKEINEFIDTLNMRSIVDDLLDAPDNDIPQSATINLKKYLPFEYHFNSGLSKFDVSAFGKNYSFEINRYNNSNKQSSHVITVNEYDDENKLCQFIALRVMAVLLAEIYKDDYKELLTLTFEDFCNPHLPFKNLNYQEIYSMVVHFFKLKDFLAQARLYIDYHPHAAGIKDAYVRLLKFVKLNNFIYSILRQEDYLNSFYSYEYLSNFVKELEMENHGLQRTAFACYPQFKVTEPREVSTITSNLVRAANSI